ncbi:sensor histidine kinase [Streptosporangium sp. NBC_01755]|uniref:sensor histidine kinase n=1 Tax=unclassified Streptosporangium TaxID=2632669 RepID=UPI002DDC53EF|nr:MULTISPECIES: sensor histidine kinase [unclassified Streptosporangium]WSA26907.1 sensor histidine kinase [Streptosporangium sp. NBC_01810]WSD01668.1 sensor histidine kinase [Streptosporangium sp. NBC_01755]
MSRRFAPSAVDWLIAAVTAAFGLTEELSERTSAFGHEQSWWLPAAVLAAAGLVLVRRRAPLTILAVYSLVSAVSFAHLGDLSAAWQFHVQLILLFTLVSETPPRDPRIAIGLVVTGLFVGSMMLAGDHPSIPRDLAVAVVMTSIAGGTGLAVWRHRQVAIQARERGELLDRKAVAEERTRIVRELHDVVAHSVSVMVMQAGAARLMLRPDQLVERETLTVVEEAGREAVEELRRMLGLLRTDSNEDELAPQPNLARLEDLVEQVHGAGLEVELAVEGEARPLPAGLELSAYRIIQEALTNTLKHAGPARVTVTVSHRPRTLSLEVVDDGPRHGHTGPRGAGHGLIGMRERVALFHGRLATGPLPDGGYRVSASFPLTTRATGEEPAG